MRLRLLGKLWLSYLILILAGQVVVGGYLYYQETKAYEEQIAIRLETLGRVLQKAIPVNLLPPWDEWAKTVSRENENIRISVIDLQGKVWADSHEPSAGME